jgi:hypothetical protein
MTGGDTLAGSKYSYGDGGEDAWLDPADNCQPKASDASNQA